MKELQQLLENDLLSEETRKDLTEAFNKKLDEVREEIVKEQEVKYAKKLVESNQKLFDVIEEQVSNEISELKEDLQKAKKMEITYAKKLEEFKEKYSAEMNPKIMEAVEAFAKKEFDQLKADLQKAKSNNFGMKVFEAFREEYDSNFVDKDTKELKAKIDESVKHAKALEEQVEQYKRKEILDGLMENLTKNNRSVMEHLLESVQTDKLEEKFEQLLPSVINEEIDEKGNKLTEEPTSKGKVIRESLSDLTEEEQKELENLRRLSGISKKN